MPLFFLASILLATILAPRGTSPRPACQPIPRDLLTSLASKRTVDAGFGAWEKGGGAVSLLDPATGLFQYEAFLHLLLRETGRGTRYRDFFTLCLFKADVAPEDAQFEPAIEVALSTRVAARIRSTALVGRFPTGLGALLVDTAHREA